MSAISPPPCGLPASTRPRPELAEAFWPGPLTLVLPKTNDCAVADLATAGLDTIAIRVPAHPVARAILRAFGGAGGGALGQFVGACLADHQRPMCRATLTGRIDLIIDGGAVAVGVESTIVGCFEAPMLLRPGGLPRGEIERVLGRALVRPPEDAGHETGQPLAPGMLASHYAPRTPVRLNAGKRRGRRGAAGVRARRQWRALTRQPR